MPDTTSNKRIAKNTLMLYVRMLFSMAVSFYTSRVVLQTLGVSDYGVYSVVGGVVGMLGFLNATMSGATSRFLTYELGRGNKERLSLTFNAALIVHIGIALFVFVVAETLGLWFVYNKLVIPDGRMTVAVWVYQLSIASSLLGITQVPYNASIISHEKMDVYAYVEIVHVILNLLIVYLLLIGNFDKLLLYAVLVFIVSLFILFVYRVYAIRNFPECRFQLKLDKKILNTMLSFSGWEVLGHFGFTFRYQGTNIVLNMFFGAIINAAVGIASVIQGVLLGFSNNILMAIKPQIVKRYSTDNVNSMANLVNSAIRINFFLMFLISVPCIIEMPIIIHTWLGCVPDYCVVFAQISLLSNVLSSYSTVIYSSIQATGCLRRTSINRIVIYASTPIVLYLLFKSGVKIPEIAFWALFVGQVLQCFFDIHVLVKEINLFKRGGLLMELLKAIGIFIIVLECTWSVINMFPPSYYRLIFTYFLSLILIVITFHVFIFKKAEKQYIKSIIKSLYDRIHS